MTPLENSTYVTNLLVEELNIPMETTGDEASWINEKIKYTIEAFTT